MKKHLTLLFLIFISSILFAQTDTIYCNVSAQGANDGTSWEDAFTFIPYNMYDYAKPGDHVWIAKGEYQGGIIFGDSTSIYGGFIGGETSIDERNIAENETIIKGGYDDRPNVLKAKYEPFHKFVLDGVTVRDGFASLKFPAQTHSLFHNSLGGGLYIAGDGGGPNSVMDILEGPLDIDIRNCIFINNRGVMYTPFGCYNGIYIGGEDTKVEIKNCVFDKTGVSIGGLFTAFRSKINVNIDGNSFVDSGLSLIQQSFSEGSSVVNNCNFSGNEISFGLSSSCKLSKILNSNFEGLFTGANSRIIENCNFKNCISGSGAAEKIMNCRFSNSLEAAIGRSFLTFVQFHDTDTTYSTESNYIGTEMLIENCVFENNKNRAINFLNKCVIINNCVFYNNRSNDYGGVIRSATDTVKIYNSIFYQNKGLDSNIIYSPATIVENCLFDIDNCIWFGDLNYSLVMSEDEDGDHLLDTVYGEPFLSCKNNIFKSEPYFKDTTQGDFHLTLCSPAINAGLNSIVDSLGLIYDFEGNPRVLDGTVDMGVYEYGIDRHVEQPKCFNGYGSIEFTSTIGEEFLYHWEKDSMVGDNLSELSAGIYNITVSSGGCDFETIQVIDTIGDMIIEYNIRNIENNPNDKDGYIDILSVSGGTPPYQFEWSNGATTSRINFLTFGDYSVDIIDGRGCISHKEFVVLNNANPIDSFSLLPNLVKNNSDIDLHSGKSLRAKVVIIDELGRRVFVKNMDLQKGSNILKSPQVSGVYFMLIKKENELVVKKFVVY